MEQNREGKLSIVKESHDKALRELKNNIDQVVSGMLSQLKIRKYLEGSGIQEANFKKKLQEYFLVDQFALSEMGLLSAQDALIEVLETMESKIIDIDSALSVKATRTEEIIGRDHLDQTQNQDPSSLVLMRSIFNLRLTAFVSQLADDGQNLRSQGGLKKGIAAFEEAMAEVIVSRKRYSPDDLPSSLKDAWQRILNQGLSLEDLREFHEDPALEATADAMKLNELMKLLEGQDPAGILKQLLGLPLLNRLMGSQ